MNSAKVSPDFFSSLLLVLVIDQTLFIYLLITHRSVHNFAVHHFRKSILSPVVNFALNTA